MDALVALWPASELAAACLCGFVWLRSRSRPYAVAAALALGIVLGLGGLSLLFQLSFLLGMPQLSPLLEGVALAVMLWFNRHHWGCLRDIPQRCRAAWRTMPAGLTVFAIALIYLWLQAYLLPPSSWDALTYHLPRVLLWEQNHSLFLQTYTISPQASFPVGSDILYHLFLRFQLDYGLGLFSWLSYLVILLATYGLARPRVSPAIALTTALVMACLPEIVYQATATKNDIVFAAVALACMLWGDRWLRLPALDSLLGLGLTLCFGIAVKTSFVFFAFFFVLVWLACVIHKRQALTLLGLLMQHWRALLLCCCPALILLQVWLFAYNAQQFGSLLGPPLFALKNQNNEGLLGAVANLTRYGFQAIHLLAPFNWFWQACFGQPWTDGLQLLYDRFLAPLWGRAGFSALVFTPFTLLWQPQEDTSWFGPVSLLLVFPAAGWCLVRGQGLARGLVMVAGGVILAISYKLGWSPWKARFFTPVLVCLGLAVALFLQRYQSHPLKLKLWRWASLGILVYACLYNYSKPMVPSDHYLGLQNIWRLSDWTRDRMVYDRLYSGNQAQAISQALSQDRARRLAIVGYDHYFSLMFQNPELEFVLLLAEPQADGTHGLAEVEGEVAAADHLVCFQERCREAGTGLSLEPIWGNALDGPGPVVYRVGASPQARQPDPAIAPELRGLARKLP